MLSRTRFYWIDARRDNAPGLAAAVGAFGSLPTDADSFIRACLAPHLRSRSLAPERNRAHGSLVRHGDAALAFAQFIQLSRVERPKGFFPSARPADCDVIDSLRAAQAAVDARVMAGAVTLIRYDLAPADFSTGLNPQPCVDGERSFLVQHPKHYPMAAPANEVSQQVRRSVAIDYDQVDAPVVVQVAQRQAATGSHQRLSGAA